MEWCLRSRPVCAHANVVSSSSDAGRNKSRLAGSVAAFMIMLVFWSAMHVNSLILLALGLPFDRALPWHKALAWSTIANSILHCISYFAAPASYGSMQDAEHLVLERGATFHMAASGAQHVSNACANATTTVQCLCIQNGGHGRERESAASLLVSGNSNPSR